jgi:capsular polysaccharide export protein
MSARVRPPRRSFLFLQGMANGFFAELGLEMARRGYGVRRINFNGGDRLFWKQPGSANFRGSRKAWPGFFTERLREWDVTDVVLFGDSRPLHADAIPIARRAGVRVHVVEEGYIRPNCITVEENGVNGHSALPKTPSWFRREAALLPPWDGGAKFANGFARRAREDVEYTIASLVLSPFYPGFRTHRPWHPLVEYAGWISRLLSKRSDQERSTQNLERLAASGSPYYLFPLQLDCDTQIRIHSPFKRLAPSIHHVVQSFATHAPTDALLVLKEHPLDNRLTNWRRVIRRAARAHGVEKRVVFIEDAPLERLLSGARSVVTVNSTTGVLALASGLPVKALGEAVYDMPDLTFQGSLDAFWKEGRPPDAITFNAFRRVLMQRTQVNGGFYSPEGLQAAVMGAADKIESSQRRETVEVQPPNRARLHFKLSA